ncbi:peptigoglycan-binding protein LysM [Pseudomonas sp. MAP12]|uniref:Peptigoglycan-binding protein LysM n=1 Tax=Geopseudomonas aromaticivorans TaxID=2849492 RepID=A0ABS6N0N8_9GAMM|nr:FimV/HubP family polar landmark protein [Pseudomonas aromaticivorans]MBV2134615.1 peptigoglycan-binding protein LysM [Pseudomonas aromaticivorans]
MVRVRKLVLAIAAASALTSGMAHALGLGEISLKSSLNQPLDAEIELLEVRDLGSNEVLPSLAAVEEFSKVGVDRPFFLTDLKFTPVLKANGKSVIRVTSSKPVREPYLNFLVEVLWPNGRLLREYTVLLDPPLYSPQTVVAASPRLPQAAPVAPRVSVAPRAPVSRPQAAAPAGAPAAPAPSRIDGDQYRTDRDDTLWEVASRVRPSSAVSVHQTMLAIQDLNPNAFLDGNINRLKSSQVLRLPTEQQIRSRSQADALAQVQAQNGAWREGRAVQPVAARQLDATRRSEAGNAPAQAPAEDNLRLVGAASGKSASGSDNAAAGDSKALADKLAVSQESLVTSQRENQELKERLTDLQSQLDKLQRLIELKNEQMAKLQGGLVVDAQAKPADTASASAQSAVAAPASAPAVAPAPVAAPAAPAAADAAAPASPAPVPAAAESKPAEPTPAPAATPAAQPAAVPAAAKPAVVKPAVVKPVATPASVYEPGLLDEVLANPLLLAAAGGALALLAGLGLTINSRRKSRKSAEEAELFQQPDLSAMQADVTPAAGLSVQAGDLQSPAAQTTGLKSADPLGEAEMYSTYGRFNQAAELLRNAVNDEPQRADLRLKLMEIYAEMGDRDGFVRQEAELGEIGGAQPQIDQLRARYPQILASGAAIAAGAALAADAFDSEPEVAAPESVAAAQAEPAEEFSFDDFSLDDVSLDAAPAAVSSVAGEPVAALDDGFDLSLDDLEAELERELAANPAAAVEAPLQLDELSLDGLGDDFASLDSAPAAAPLLEGDEADFGLDLDLAAVPAGGEALQSSSEVDDFAFELGDVQLPTVDQVLAVPQDQAEEDQLLAELDQLALDAPAAPAAAESDEFLLDLADLDLGQPSAAPVALAETELAALPELDDLELELQTLSGADAEQDLDAAFDDFLTRSELPELSSAPAPVPAVETLDELPELDDLAFETTPAPALTGNEDFDFLADADETATKLDLARAYIDMGDADGARDILDEVLKEGTASQQQEAREMMGRIA